MVARLGRLRVAARLAGERPHRDVADLAAPVRPTRHAPAPGRRAHHLDAAEVAHRIHEVARLRVVGLHRPAPPAVRRVGIPLRDAHVPFAVRADRLDEPLREGEVEGIVERRVLDRHARAVAQGDERAPRASPQFASLEIDRHALHALQVDARDRARRDLVDALRHADRLFAARERGVDERRRIDGLRQKRTRQQGRARTDQRGAAHLQGVGGTVVLARAAARAGRR